MRLTGKVLTHDKTYIAVLDVPESIDDEALEAGLSQLRGRVYNVPPEISAVKVQVRTRRIERLVLLNRARPTSLWKWPVRLEPTSEPWRVTSVCCSIDP